MRHTTNQNRTSPIQVARRARQSGHLYHGNRGGRLGARIPMARAVEAGVRHLNRYGSGSKGGNVPLHRPSPSVEDGRRMVLGFASPPPHPSTRRPPPPASPSGGPPRCPPAAERGPPAPAGGPPAPGRG